jgi:methylamine--corrinoid protein Co-methyltransferase
MITLFDIAERTQTSEKVDENKWDMEFYNTISQLVAKYKIQYPGDPLFINMDDDLVERAFEAGIEFLEKMGVYCITTRRRVRLTRDEIFTAIREAPAEILMGEGRDRRIWKQRQIEGKLRYPGRTLSKALTSPR